MISILVIADLADCRAIESTIRNSLNVGEYTAVIYRNTTQETWQLYRCNPYAYDFAIVDIGQENVSLKQTMEILRQAVICNSALEVIFITGRDYVPVDIYNVRHLHLVKKPLSADKICELMKLIFYKKKLRDRDDLLRFQVRHGRNIYMVHRDEVRYAKKARYGLDLVTVKEIVPFDKKMTDFLQEWGNSFFRCHDSFAVNIRHVAEVRYNSIFLCNGEEIPVSRAYKKSVKEYFDSKVQSDDIAL